MIGADFAFFYVISWSNNPILWLKGLLDSRLWYKSLEPLINFLVFMGLNLWLKIPNILGIAPRVLAGISLINLLY